MPGNPNECREHAKRCLQLADETTNPVLKKSLTDIAAQWTRLATDLEVTRQLLGEFGSAQPKLDEFSDAVSNAFSEALGTVPPPSEEGNTA
jgi:hypothetical protein